MIAANRQGNRGRFLNPVGPTLGDGRAEAAVRRQVCYAWRIMTMIADNLSQVRTRIANACQRAGRKPTAVTLLAVLGP